MLKFFLPLALLAAAAHGQDVSDWYPFQATGTPEPGAIGMQDWFEKPAGKHGRITRQGGQLHYNGKPIKLWGINNTYADCAPGQSLAQKRAAFYAKFGINAVRLHKYADGTGWAGIQAQDSFLEFDAEALERMDYYIAQLKEQGIYTKLSSTFGVKLGPADRKHVPYIDEFGDMGRTRLSTGHGSIYLSKELQDLQIQQIVQLLEHRNPHTGLTYAQDPAIAVVELFNEDSALWFGTLSQLQKVPTLRQRAARQFSQWLRARYKDHQGLIDAWGPKAIDAFKNEGFTGEHLDKNNIVPAGNPWFYDPVQIAGSQARKRQRLLDTMQFLYEIQNDFYDRYVAAIRAAGYQGEILASNWQAGRGISHYYNLHSDYRIGLIDRHNYFGGAGRGLKPGKFNNASMLRTPGSGMLSAGMQQAADRPFMLSEWIHVAPNDWGAEGPAIIAAYGMGLNGWDVSFMFQNKDTGAFSPRLGGHPWDVTAPQILGLFPAVARQVLRGDVQESPVTATRYVHPPALHQGKLGFQDQIRQTHDVKTFDSDKVPARTLAAARATVQFTDAPQDTPPFDLSPYQKDGALRSSTGQLAWYEGDSPHSGHITIDTPATQAVIGFAQGQTHRLGDLTITLHAPFAALYVTALGQDADIANGKRLLITAIARARNTGQKLNRAQDEIIAPGQAPILMEPVRATIVFHGKRPATLTLLDHDGRPNKTTRPVLNSTITLDGAKDKTLYYLIQY